MHSHPQRRSHQRAPLDIPEGYVARGAPHSLTRDKLELFAVLCIETSHYVSFIKYGPGSQDWIFFDSMADREGEWSVFMSFLIHAPFVYVLTGSAVRCVQERETDSTSRRFKPAPRLAGTWKCLPQSWPIRCLERWKVWRNVSSVMPTCTCIRAPACVCIAERTPHGTGKPHSFVTAQKDKNSFSFCCSCTVMSFFWFGLLFFMNVLKYTHHIY